MTECVIEGWDGNDGPDCEFHSAAIRTARKPHGCGECGRIIEPGERYEKAVGKWDGDFCTETTCADCLSLRQTFFCSWMYQNLWDEFENWLNDWLYDDSPTLYKIENLTPRARNRVLDMISEWEEENDD